MLMSRHHSVMTRNKTPFQVGRAIVTPRALWVLDPSVGESIELGLVSRNYDGFAKLQGRGVWFRETIKITKTGFAKPSFVYTKSLFFVNETIIFFSQLTVS